MGGGEECYVERYVGDFVGDVFDEAVGESELRELEGCGEDDGVE